MADLRTLLYTNAVQNVSPTPVELLVFNPSIDTPDNGGRCCLFTTPANVSWIEFQIWGGGGGGSGSCCCMQGRPGGAGAYSKKLVRATPGTFLTGCQYTICAGATSGATPSQPGCGGYTSYVTGFGLSNYCARGGQQGSSWCWGFCSCSSLGPMDPNQCCSTGGDIDFHGVAGGGTSSTYCFGNGKQWATVPPMTISGPLMGPGGCACGGIGNTYFCYAVFPGGGGFTAQAYDGACRCGIHGGGGLVSVYYG